MSNFDWSELGINDDVEMGTSTDQYVPSSKFPPPPPIGDYDVQGITDSLKFGRDKNNNLYARGSFEVVGGDFDGRRVDGFISSRVLPFREDGTDMDDFARASGTRPANGKRYTEKEMVQLIESSFGQTRKVFVNWEGYCSECKMTVAKGKTGAKKENKDGFRQVGFGDIPYVICPICGANVGARGRIQKYYVV